MKQHIFIFLILITVFTSCKVAVTRDLDAQIVPEPEKMVLDKGEFVFSSKTTIAVDNSAQQSDVASQLAGLFEQSAGFVPKFVDDVSQADVAFVTDSTLKEEAYRLIVSADKVRIESSDSKGAYYGVQTLRQLLPAELESPTVTKNVCWNVPVLTIEDSPRFEYRGLMLDVSRFFMPKETVLKIINAAAMLKINKLHFHLVDDQGWRLEIKKYPKLTEVGAWRVYREGPFSLKKNPTAPGEETPVGGYYTQADIKEIVSFAAERQIEVIPEIEMPAHSNSALAAYPQYACPVIDHYISVLPGMGGRNSNVVYCAGNDSVYAFLQDVLDEVLELFPSEYIHLGGDEANKEAWEKCPKCRARMRKEGITNVEDLQGYFMDRMTKYVQSKGRTVIGWDEWTNSKVPEGAVIFGWQGLGTAGYKAAQQGHKFVMTPSQILYLDYYQGPQWFEPRTYFGNNTMKKIYDYEPVQADWEAKAAENLLGVQASMWTEFIESPEHVEYMVFPRVAALADIAWAQKGTKNWAGFLKRLDKLTKRWEYMGIGYSKSMYNLDHVVKPENDELKVILSCTRPDVDIRYTLDGTSPTFASTLYTDTLVVTKNVVVKAATFVGEESKGEVLTLDLKWNKATGKAVIGNTNPNVFLLTNGVRGTDKHTDFEWCGWYNQNVSFTLDLGEEDTFDKVTLGHVVNYGMGVHYPKSIVLSVSDDNKQFKKIGTLSFTEKEIFRDGIYMDEFKFDDLSSKGRYLKFDITSPGETPSFHHRAGQGVWLYFDEIGVY